MWRRGSTSVCLCAVMAACARGPAELGFWFDAVTFTSTRLGGALTPAEMRTIEAVARAEIVRAFAPYTPHAVSVTANPSARYRVAVVPWLEDWRLVRGGTYAGESRATRFGGSGSVNFNYVANGAMVFSPESASRVELVEAIGRGVGRVAIHEFLHQLLPKQPIHDSKDSRSYEGNSPALVEGYFGDLHWDIARPWLEARLLPRQ
jgi:hypothetical protein